MVFLPCRACRNVLDALEEEPNDRSFEKDRVLCGFQLLVEAVTTVSRVDCCTYLRIPEEDARHLMRARLGSGRAPANV